MPFRESGQVKIFYFELFDREHLVHGFYTRHGGVSPSPWDSLNLGGTVGDSRENVIENRRRIFDTVGRGVETIFDSWQVHGIDVICAEKPRDLDSPHQKADAILTNKPEITLLMRFADCVPIILFDPNKRVIGLVHAGWRGTVAKVTLAAILQMQLRYGCSQEDIMAGIGPSICRDHYEVGEEVVDAVKKTFGESSKAIMWKKNGSHYFDLWLANQLVLEHIGVKKIEQSGICTFCNNRDWYSHRAERGKTGRFGALIALK